MPWNEEQRVLLVSVPYALKALDADTLGGHPASAYVLAPSCIGAPPSELPDCTRRSYRHGRWIASRQPDPRRRRYVHLRRSESHENRLVEALPSSTSTSPTPTDAVNRLTQAGGVARTYDAAGRITMSNGIRAAHDDAGQLAVVTYATGKEVR